MKNPATLLALGALAALLGSCGRPAAAPPSPGARSPESRTGAAMEAAPGSRELRICVLQGGRLIEVPVTYVVATGDTLYEGRLFREAFPDTAGYASNRRWYVTNEPILWEQRNYIKFGLPRVLNPSAVRPVTEYMGVLLFAEVGDGPLPGVLYAPTRTGCEFHPYQWDLMMRGVRG